MEHMKYSTANPKSSHQHIQDASRRYKDLYADMVMADGIVTLCDNLLGATMCEFSKQEFVGGLQSLGIDSLEKFCEWLPSLHSEINDEQKFKEIYIFAFGWAKEKGQKSLALDTAIGTWQLLFAEKQWPLVDNYCRFLQMVDPGLLNYDAEAAWPYLYDEFVEYLIENTIIQRARQQNFNRQNKS